jgi:hypothetical protein
MRIYPPSNLSVYYDPLKTPEGLPQLTTRVMPACVHRSIEEDREDGRRHNRLWTLAVIALVLWAARFAFAMVTDSNIDGSSNSQEIQ